MAFTYDDPGNPNGQSNQAFFNQMTAQATGQPPPAPKQESGPGVGTAIGVGALLTGAGAIALAMKKGKFSNLKPLTKSNDDVAESTIAKSHEAVKEKYIPKDDVVPSAPIVREASPIKREEVRVGPIDDMMKPRSTTYNTGILDKIFTDGGRLEMRDFRDMPDDKIFDLYGKWDSAAAAMAKNDPASDKAKSWTHNFENLQNELSTRGYTFSKVKEGDELDGIRMQSFGTQHSDTIDVDGVTEVFGSGQVVYRPNGQVALPVNVRTSDGPAPHVIPERDPVAEVRKNGGFYDSEVAPYDAERYAYRNRLMSKSGPMEQKQLLDAPSRTPEQIQKDSLAYQEGLNKHEELLKGKDPDELIPIIHGGNSNFIEHFLSGKGGYKVDNPMPHEGHEMMNSDGMMFHSEHGVRARDYAERTNPFSMENKGEPAILMGHVPRKYAHRNNDYSGYGDEYSVPSWHSDKIVGAKVLKYTDDDYHLFAGDMNENPYSTFKGN